MALILRAVPVWVWALAAALGWGAWQRHTAQAAEHALAAQREAGLVAQVKDTQLQLDTQKEAVGHAHEQTAQAEAAADAASAALGRLRVRLAQAARPASTPAAASGSTPAEAGSDMCADMLGRLGEAARRIASEATKYRIAGEACEAIDTQH